MKTYFLPAKVNVKIKKIKGDFEVVTTTQFYDSVKKVYPSAKKILGCDTKNITGKKDFLFIGSGEFHPLALAKFKKNVTIYNPTTNKIKKFNYTPYLKRQKGKLAKFLMSKKIGILVSTKPGQYNLKIAQKLSKRYKAKIFITDEIRDLENFPEIEFWVNTACPRIQMKNVIHFLELGPTNSKCKG